MPKQKQTAGRKRFSPEEKAEAVRLLTEEQWTAKDVALHYNCSINAVQNWKAEYKSKDLLPRGTEPYSTEEYQESKSQQTTSSPKAVAPSFDAFVRKYWQDKAVDVLLMKQETSMEIVKHVNEALQYAYDNMQR